MSTDLDRRLRAALHDVADVAAPRFRPAAAVAGARRRRRRQVTALVAGVAAVGAVAVAVPVVALRPAPVQPAAPAARTLVAGYAYSNPRIVDPTNLGDYRVYDRRAGRYVETPWRTAVPSPDGRHVAVTDWTDLDRTGIVPADRVLDRTAVRWVANPLGGPPRMSPVWSPDGSRVLLDATFSVTRAAGGYRVDYRVLVVDGRSLAARVVPLRTVQELSPLWAGKLVFAPDGNLAVAVNFAALPNGLLVRFDARGRAVGEVRIGPATVPDQPFSPDGRLVAVHRIPDPAVTGSTRLLATANGAEVGRTDGYAVGWLDGGRYAVRSGGVVRAVEVGSGRVVGEQRLAPDGSDLTGVWSVPLRGPAPAGAIVI